MKISNIINLLKKHKYFLLILLVGFILRIYKYDELFLYGHDHDLAGWFVRDVVFNKHLRLIGQETSTAGIYIGPIYYYLLIPFYALTKFDPIGGVIMIALLGIFSIWSVYFTFNKIFGRKEALIATFFYAISFYTIENDRQVFPTTPVITWTFWYFYSLDLIVKGKFKKGFTMAGILIGLIWHLNVALVLLLPLLVLAIILSRKKPEKKKCYRGLLFMFMLSIPLILFEAKHNFIQVRSLVSSFTSDQGSIYKGIEQLRRVLYILGKNLSGLMMGSFEKFPYIYLLLGFIFLFLFLYYKRAIQVKISTIILFWFALYVSFFSLYSKNLSEYYLNGTVVLFLLVLTSSITFLLKNRTWKYLGVIIMALFAVFNFHRFFFNQYMNRSGYIERKGVVNLIKEDAEKNDYPCVAISYITGPGYDLGYRYFLWLYNIKVKKPSSLAPVYTIVYPLRDDIKVDKTIGAIGLIYPDYSSYNTERVKKSCEGENVNITEPMWGLPM